MCTTVLREKKQSKRSFNVNGIMADKRVAEAVTGFSLTSRIQVIKEAGFILKELFLARISS